jgi:hypothetical protein
VPTIRKYMPVILAALVVLPFAINAYFVRNEAGCSFIWNAKEAYLTVGESTLGYHVKLAGYPFEAGLALLWNVALPDDIHRSRTLVHVSASGVERYALHLSGDGNDLGPGVLTRRDGRLWANWPTHGGLCWWASDHFEPASKEQRSGDWLDYTNPRHQDEGWSFDGVTAGAEYGRNVMIRLADDIELLVAGQGGKDGRGRLSVDVMQPGHEPVRLINIEVGAGRVSRSDYQRVFRHGK